MLTRKCSWCDQLMGTVESPETGITHGICPECSDRLLEEIRQQPLTTEAESV